MPAFDQKFGKSRSPAVWRSPRGGFRYVEFESELQNRLREAPGLKTTRFQNVKHSNAKIKEIKCLRSNFNTRYFFTR